MKLVFKGVNLSSWNFEFSYFRGSILVNDGPGFFPTFLGILLFLLLGSHRGLLAFLPGLIFLHLGLQQRPNQFLLIDILFSFLHKLRQSNRLCTFGYINHQLPVSSHSLHHGIEHCFFVWAFHFKLFFVKAKHEVL
jgi:hypothetical protein